MRFPGIAGQVVNADGSMRLEIKVPDEEAPRVVTAPPEAGGASASELPDVKAVNEEGMEDRTDGRGGVDDLIDLTHLHEPAILHVLVRVWDALWRCRARAGENREPLFESRRLRRRRAS